MNLLLLDVDESYTVMIKVPRVKQKGEQHQQQQQQEGEPPDPVHQQQQQQQQGQQSGGRGLCEAGDIEMAGASAAGDIAGGSSNMLQEAVAGRGAAVAAAGAAGAGGAAPAGRGGGGCARLRWCRKQERRFRHMEQLFVRGDNVVLISAASEGVSLANVAER